MDQFRHVGEVLGGMKALMVLKHDILINQRQCCLLLNIFDLAFETVSDEIRQNLRLEDKNTKWKALEHPLRELHRVFKECELYIRHCLDVKDWWGKAMSLHQNNDCVEFHIHNLLCCFAIVIEALETAGEISGPDQDDMQKRRLMLMRKYDGDSSDLKIFQWKYGKQYLVSREICNELGSAWREDRWILLEKIREKRNTVSVTEAKHEQRIADLLIRKLSGLEPVKGKLLPAWILIGAKDYHVKRRLGSGGSHCKEIQWLGESFALKNFFGEMNEQLQDEISSVLSLSHPNVTQYLCGFYDEERKEGFLVMELMNKSLAGHMKENCGQRKRLPFSIPVAVDIMLQIARGLEYLHSRKIYHGDLNPSNILLKARNPIPEGYFFAKVTGFGLTSIKSYTSRAQTSQNGDNPIRWYAPEVQAEQEQQGGGKCSSKYGEKADVYSFGMLCFEILTGKVPFEEGHLQEDKMGRNIRAGERPLFPYNSPKYLVNLTRKCWQAEPTQRPSFSSICRILRYIKKCLVINPDHGQPESPPPLVDYCEIEAGYSKLFPGDGSPYLAPVSQVPFQMFAYKLIEREKTSGSFKDKIWDLAIETRSIWGGASVFGDDNGVVADDSFLVPIDQRSVCSEVHERKTLSKIGADQRSVCSETPGRRVQSFNTAADQMSFRSEFLWRKMDQRSVGSVTPERKFFPTASTDQKSIGYVTPERKIFAHDQISVGSETPERKFVPTTETEQISGHSENGERKDLPVSAMDGKNQSPESPEKKPDKKLATTIAANQNSVGSKLTKRSTFPATEVDKVSPESHETKTLSRAVSTCSKSLERKVLPPIASDSDFSSICSESPKKKKTSKKSSDVWVVRPEVRDRKCLVKPNVAVAETSKGPGTKKCHSPRSSPILVAKGHSPASSPKSPALSPCSRCLRMNRECRVPSIMSPSRRQRSHVSDSEMA
ncbi:Protein kinase [Actinidia chinensis var. chinensis]|uniref:Protein kinase n=1 Tax=Actinidia chinensis var. chinensis TaxID=1590841 RepID=A0A2R6QJ30_ACTCC|nr:Protein kinase [Actinidia chinensis var. chinensis]